MTIQRYDIDWDNGCSVMSDSGAFVGYEDHTAATQDREAEIAQLKTWLARSSKAVDAYIADEEDNVAEIAALRKRVAELESTCRVLEWNAAEAGALVMAYEAKMEMDKETNV